MADVEGWQLAPILFPTSPIIDFRRLFSPAGSYSRVQHATFCGNYFFYEECTFARDTAFNTHNKHAWAFVNPHAHQRNFCINVWGGIIDDHIIEPYLLLERIDEKKILDDSARNSDRLARGCSNSSLMVYVVPARRSASPCWTRRTILSGCYFFKTMNWERRFCSLTATIDQSVVSWFLFVGTGCIRLLLIQKRT